MTSVLLDRPQSSLFDDATASRRGATAPAAPRTGAPARPAAPPEATPAARSALFGEPAPSAPPMAAAVGGQARLEDVISGVWEDLVVHRAASCLVCGGRMVARYGAAGHAPVGGRCTDCGSVLG